MKTMLEKYPMLSKLLVVVAVLILFIGYLQYNRYKQTHFKVNKQAFSSEASWDAYVQSETNQFSWLYIANRFGLLSDIKNKSMIIPSDGRDIKFEKMMFSQGRIYLVYSISMKKSDQKIETIPKLNIQQVTLHINGGKTMTAKVTPVAEGQLNNDGHAIGNRIYRGMFLQIRWDQLKSIDNQKLFTETLPKLKAVTLEDVTYDQGDKKKKVKLNNIKLPASYIDVTKVLKTIPMNQTVTIHKGLKLMIKDARIYSYGTLLDYKFIGDKNIRELRFHYTSDSQKIRSYYTNDTDVKHPQIFLNPLNGPSTTYALELVQYQYLSNDSFDFSVNQSQIEKAIQLAKQGKDIKIGHISKSDVYFGVNDQFPSTTGEKQMYLKVKSDDPFATSQLMFNNIYLYKQNYKLQNDGMMSKLRVMNEKGKDLESTQRAGFMYKNAEEIFKINVKQNELSQVKRLRFQVTPLYYKKILNNQKPFKVTINVGKKAR